MMSLQQHDGRDSIGEWVQKSSVDTTVVGQQKEEGSSEYDSAGIEIATPTCSQ